MRNLRWIAPLLLIFAFSADRLRAQPAKPDPDVLIFTDGEKLIGHLKSVKGSSIVFQSDMAGEITVDWSKIQELRTAGKFAAIPKGARLRNSRDIQTIPQGTISMTSKNVEVTQAPPAAPRTLAAADVSNVVEQGSFERAFHHTRFIQGWKGGATAGFSLTDATQTSTTFTGAVNLVRAVPSENWLDARSRTIFNFNDAYGTISQPGSPTVKTSVLHSDLQQDWYLNPRLYALGEAAFDHSFSQGLTLQQSYGAGLGVVVEKTAAQELDFKVTANYIDQRFSKSGLDQQLFGTVFGETYVRKFPHGILLSEQGSITPAWNQTSAYSSFGSAAVMFPVFHRLGFTAGAVDNFLNDPPPGFRKNSFQLSLGATYAFQ